MPTSLLPTGSPTTPFPTTIIKRRKRFEIRLFGSFDDVEQYVNNSNKTLEIWAIGVIKVCLKYNNYPSLSNIVIVIFNVKKEALSLILRYKLKVMDY